MSLCRNRNPYDDESFNNPDKINLNDNQSNKLSAGSLRRTKKNKTRMPKDFVFNEEEELKLSQLKKKNSLLDLTDSEEDKEKDININSENSIEKDGEKDKDKIVEIINTDLPNKDIKNEEMKNEENKNEEEKEKENESEKKEEKNEEDIKIEDMENNKENIINNSEDKNIDDKDITNGIKEEHIEKEENKKEENKKEENKKEENIINEEEKKENKVEKEIDNKKENIEEKNDDIENKEKKEEKEIKEELVEKDEENIEINKKDEQKTEENVEKEEENIQKNKNEEEKDNNEIKQEIKEEKKEKLLSEIINNVEEGKEDKELLRTKPNPNLKEDKKEKEEEYLDEEEEEEEEEDDDEDDKNKKEEPKNESTDLEIKDLSKYETLIKIININLESFGYSKIDIKKEIDNLYGAFSDKTSSDDLVSNLSEKLIKLMEVSQENDKTELKNFINTLVNFYKGNKDEVYKQLMEYTEKIIDQDQLTTRRMNRGIRSNIQECKDKLKDRLKKEDIPSDKIITIEKFEKIVEETELQMKDNHMDVLLYQMKKKVPKGRNFNTLNAIVIVDFLK